MASVRSQKSARMASASDHGATKWYRKLYRWLARRFRSRADKRLPAKRLLYRILQALVIVLLLLVGVLVAWALRLYFTAWNSGTSTLETSSIGLVALEGTDLSNSFVVSNSPSLDLAPSLTSDSTLNGVFRLNALTTPDEPDQQFGLVLPADSTVNPVGAGGETNVLDTGEPGEGYNGYGFSCETAGGPTDPTDPRIFVFDFAISDVGGNSYQIQCLGDRMVVWMKLAPGRNGADVNFAEGEQRLTSRSGGHVIFSIPDYPGVRRQNYFQWRVTVAIETAPNVTDAIPIGIGINQGGANDGVVTLGVFGQAFSDISPSTSTLERRAYALPVSQSCPTLCQETTLFDEGPAITWRGLMDARTHELSAIITDTDLEKEYKFVTTLALFSVGVLASLGIPSLWRRVRKLGPLPRHRRS